MALVSVRCWEATVPADGSCPSQTVYMTYPEGNLGHRLVTCTNCGEIYAVTVAKEVYVGPALGEKLAHMTCVGCGIGLADNVCEYPDQFFCNGHLHRFEKPRIIPDDVDSVVVSFTGIYE